MTAVDLFLWSGAIACAAVAAFLVGTVVVMAVTVILLARAEYRESTESKGNGR